MGQFSEYIVYVDESGAHGLATLDPDYRVFVLAFCIFRKVDYAPLAVPRLQQLKFRYFGHDMVVMHEHEIRKSQGDFRILLRGDTRAAFLHDLGALIEDVPFKSHPSRCLRWPHEGGADPPQRNQVKDLATEAPAKFAAARCIIFSHRKTTP